MKTKTIIKTLVVILCLSLVGFVVLIAYLVNMMLNRPQLGNIKPLENKNYKEFKTKNENGHKIHALFYPGKNSDTVAILCHGHGISLGQMGDMVEFLLNNNIAIILFDFRAHGKSEGKLCTIGGKEFNDIKNVIKAAKKEGFILDNTRLIAYGRSMGAASLINGSKELDEIDAFILESSFERLRNIAARDAWYHCKIPNCFFIDLTFTATDLITSENYSNNNPVEKINGIGKRPTLLIHDGLDHRANSEAFEALKAELPEAETFVVKNARHVKAHRIDKEGFEKKFMNFLKRNKLVSN
ncbi:MAG: alpha/beta hydrolase [Candidatus Rifleibacteriota bacterium]